MRILITTDLYEPTVNGVVTSVLNLKRELTRMGHQVRVLTVSQSIYSTEDTETTRLGSLPLTFIYPGARLRIIPSKKEYEDIVAWKPDIIHSQCEFNTFLTARHLANDLGIPLVHTYHTVYEDYTHYFPTRRRLAKKVVKYISKFVTGKCDCVIAPTEKVKKLLSHYRIPTPIVVTPTGIDITEFQKELPQEKRNRLREKYQIAPQQKIAVYVGRLAKEKSMLTLLKCFKKANLDGWTLLIVGDGPSKRQTEEEAQSMGLSQTVRFTGMVPPDEVADYYKLGDIFVSASTSESQGLTYIESLSAGTPILCRRDECLTGIIREGYNGWMYNGVSDFSRYLTRYAQDEHLQKRMKNNALSSSEDFSSKVFAERVLKIYEDQILAAKEAGWLGVPRSQIRSQEKKHWWKKENSDDVFW